MRLKKNYSSTAMLLMLGISFSHCAAANDVIIFADSFSDVNGHVISQTDGKTQVSGNPATRRILPFMEKSASAIGKLTISASEDPIINGFDDKPGVLAIAFQSIPSQATFCGFVYLGGASPQKSLKLKEITEAPNLE